MEWVTRQFDDTYLKPFFGGSGVGQMTSKERKRARHEAAAAAADTTAAAAVSSSAQQSPAQGRSPAREVDDLEGGSQGEDSRFQELSLGQPGSATASPSTRLDAGVGMGVQGFAGSDSRHTASPPEVNGLADSRADPLDGHLNPRASKAEHRYRSNSADLHPMAQPRLRALTAPSGATRR